jgi:predicted oxidoreductase
MGHRIFRGRLKERAAADAMGHGNSVPRFHVTRGTGPASSAVRTAAREAQKRGC